MSELISILVVLWLIFWLADLVLNGRFWLWELVSMIPGWCVLLVLVLLISATLVSGNLVGLLILLASCWLPLRTVDIRFPARRARNSAPNSIQIVNWNTQFWHYYADVHQFAQLLKSIPAQIYHLQEAMDYHGKPIDVSAELATVLPGFTIVQHGEMVSATSLPIRQVHKVSKSILRLDLEAPQGLLSVYNVHLPVQIELRFRDSPPKFFGWIKQAFKLRRHEFAILQRELAQNPLPCVIS